MAYLGGNLSKHDRKKLNKIIKIATVLIGKEQEDMDTSHEHRTVSMNMMKKILNDKTHAFYPMYVQQRIECSRRFRVQRTRTHRQIRSFFPNRHQVL